MKRNRSSLRRMFALFLPLTLFFGCSTTTTGTNPTQADRLAAIKNKVIAAANSIEREVENLRGKNFKRTVFVSVFTRSQYAGLIGNQIDTTPQSQKDLGDRIFRIEGLLRQNEDFYSSYDSTMSTETEGFYVPGSDSMYIILGDTATGLSFDDSVTIFHEFVHALQDQYFDLTGIDSQAGSTDQDFANHYVIEGEAELLENYYAYKLIVGSYPTSTDPILNQLNEDQIWADALLDSVHLAGVPLVTIMPSLWEYYAYGPKFINTIAGMNWSIIDNTIFASMPFRMLEILHPSEYSAGNEYVLNTQVLENAVSQSNVIYDEDELGELLSDVIFREWNFDSYSSISNGVLADHVIVFRDLQVDTMRMVWYTYWQDSSSAGAFFQNYVRLVDVKRNITLPPTVDSAAFAYVNDTLNDIYIEQSQNVVFTVENYSTANLSGLIAACRATHPSLRGALAKTTAPGHAQHARIDKKKLIRPRIHPFNAALRR